MFYQNKITREFGILFVDAKRQTPNMIVPENEKSFGDFEGYEQTNAPEHDPETHGVREVSPVVIGGVLTQQWEVYPLPMETVEAIRRSKVPQSISRAQGKVALIQAGMWPQVLAFVGAMTDPTAKAMAEVALNDTTEWRRDSPFLVGYAASLQLSELQLDELFTAAAQIAL